MHTHTVQYTHRHLWCVVLLLYCLFDLYVKLHTRELAVPGCLALLGWICLGFSLYNLGRRH